MAGFYLFANCNFVPDKYDDWQAAYDDLATYVYASEPTTMSYYFGLPIDYADNPSGTTSMLAFEVYGKRDDLYETHLKSAAMSTFLSKIPPTMPTGLDLMHYSKIAGSIDVPGDKRECAVMTDTRISCISATARDAVISKLRDLSSSLEKGNDGKEGIYTWMAFSNLDDDKSLRIFARFESRDAMETYQRRKDVAGFWSESKEEVGTMETQRYVPNGKGWLHR